VNETPTPSEQGIPKAAFLPDLARGVLDALPDPLFVLDLKGNVLVRNLAHKRFLAQRGLTPTIDEVGVEHVASLLEDAEGFRAFVQSAQDEVESDHEAEFRLRSSGRALSIRSSPVRLADAGTVARLVILRESSPTS
jgi:transcriptional regulator of aromatic amino acid metabolism